MRPLAIDKPPLDVPRAEASRVALDRARSWSAKSRSPNSPATACFATPASSRLREDKRPARSVREVPEKLVKAARTGELATAEGFGVRITNPDRVIFPGDELTKGDLADYYAAVVAVAAGHAGEAPDDLDPLPAGARPSIAFSRSTTAARWAMRSSMSRSRRRTARSADYLYVRRRHGDAGVRADGDDRISRLGKPDQTARKARPAGVRPRSRRRPRLRQGQSGRASGCARCSPTWDWRPSPCCRAARAFTSSRRSTRQRLAQGQKFRRALQPRDRRGRARNLHRQHPQESAQGADLPRLAAQPARRDRGDALFGPRPRQAPGRGADRLVRTR